MTAPLPAGGLYLITPDCDAAGVAALHATLAQVLPFAACVQYRNKSALSSSQRLQHAQALRQLCADAKVCFLVNDDARLAQAVAADGVHLGQGDGAVGDARALLGDAAIIGVTCHEQLALAERAAAQGADYVAFGAVFGSATKPDAVTAPLSLFAQAKGLGLPTVAIGGIDADNIAAVQRAGADFAAVIGGVFAAPNPVAAARACAAAFC